MDENNPLITVSMDIILHAGDARVQVMQAFEYCDQNQFDKARENLEYARNEITIAHKAQTDIIQEEMSGKKHEFCLLFIHAQDTLMSINSEINLAEKMIHLYENIKKEIVKK